MAILTELPRVEAEQLLQHYELLLQEITPLEAGSVNSNFFLRVAPPNKPSLTVFARIYEEQGSEGAAFELRLNQCLAELGIPVARPIPRADGELFAQTRGKPFALYERLEGEVTCQKQVNSKRCYHVGRALAQVHTADLGGLALSPSRFGFEQIRERLTRVETAGRASLLPAVQHLRAEAERLQGTRDLTLPQGLIHGDLFRDNVLLKGDAVSGLLDFESASLGPYVYDLMVTILAWCYGARLEGELAKAMVRGYCSLRPLSDKERENLVTEGSIACLRFAVTRLTDFSLRVSEGEQPIRDYQRFIDRKSALIAGALDDLF